MTEDDIGANRIEGHPLLGDAQVDETTRVIVDGNELYGIVGEPIAMTLLANGVRTSRTMPHSGAPRGYFCGVGRCPDCAMTVDGELNVMTCATPLRPGMIIRTQQGLGSWQGDD
jgi:predicted molibdopterin-dependent oxidoreductase YjgC